MGKGMQTILYYREINLPITNIGQLLQRLEVLRAFAYITGRSEEETKIVAFLCEANTPQRVLWAEMVGSTIKTHKLVRSGMFLLNLRLQS